MRITVSGTSFAPDIFFNGCFQGETQLKRNNRQVAKWLFVCQLSAAIVCDRSVLCRMHDTPCAVRDAGRTADEITENLLLPAGKEDQ